MKKRIFLFIIYFVVVFTGISTGMCQTVQNGTFDGTTSGWSNALGCPINEITNNEVGYGGSNSSNYIAEVDPGTNLCQTVSGFTVGNSYTLYFDLGRRTSTWTGGKAAPSPMKVTVCVGSSVGTGTCLDFSRSNTTWGLTNSSLTFTATATSLVVSIAPTSDAYTCCGGNNGGGMIVDNISLTAPTPVTLVNFKAVKNGSGVDLNWQTASEINNDYYEVERSKDGVKFTSIGRIKGAGNSSTVKEYAMTDYSPLSGTSYYRLKQVDYDGKFSYSKIVAVKNEEAAISVSPNPSSGPFNINMPNDKEPYNLEVRDAEGRLVYQKADISDGSSIEISGLSKGVYILVLVLGTAAVIIIRKLVVL